MAEALLARDLGASWSVESAGLGAVVGQGMEATAREVLRTRGLDLPKHVARQVQEDLLRGCDLVLVMETRHKESLESLCPWMRGRVFRLGHWEKFDIEDPYRRPREIFEQTLVRIETCCASWLPHLKAMG